MAGLVVDDRLQVGRVGGGDDDDNCGMSRANAAARSSEADVATRT